MAKKVNKVVYGNQTLLDLSSDTVISDSLLSGVTAHDKSGELVTGNIPIRTSSTQTISTKGGSVSFSSGYYSSTHIARIANDAVANLTSDNLVSGVTVLGVTGTAKTLESPVIHTSNSISAPANVFSNLFWCKGGLVPYASLKSSVELTVTNGETRPINIVELGYPSVSNVTLSVTNADPFKFTYTYYTYEPPRDIVKNATIGEEPIYETYGAEYVTSSSTALPINLGIITSGYGTYFKVAELPSSVTKLYIPTRPKAVFGTFTIPLNETYQLEFSHIVNASDVATGVQVALKKGSVKYNTVTFHSRNSTYENYPFTIYGYWRVAPDTLFIVWDCQTSATQKGALIANMVGVNYINGTPTVYVQGIRNLAPASNIPGNKLAYSSFVFNLMPTEFNHNCTAIQQLGCTYMKMDVTSANVHNKNTAYYGNYIMYTSTSASRVFLTTSSGMTSVWSDTITTSGTYLKWGLSDFMIASLYRKTTAGTSVRTLGTVFTNNNLPKYVQLLADTASTTGSFAVGHCLGQLTTGHYVFMVTPKDDDSLSTSELRICSIFLASANATTQYKVWYTLPLSFLSEYSSSDSTTKYAKAFTLLHGNILFSRISKNIYQLYKSGDSWGVKFLCTASLSYEDAPCSYPQGQYGSVFFDMGDGLM